MSKIDALVLKAHGLAVYMDLSLTQFLYEALDVTVLNL